MNQAEALYLAVRVIATKAWALEQDGPSPAGAHLVARLREAAMVLQRMEPLYIPGSEAWVRE